MTNEEETKKERILCAYAVFGAHQTHQNNKNAYLQSICGALNMQNAFQMTMI